MKDEGIDWEGWHFHHLARRARTFGLPSNIIKILENTAWNLIKTNITLNSLSPSLKRSLERIASIRTFDRTCENPECPICTKVVKKFFSGEFIDEPWKLSLELYKWQKQAKKLWWDNNARGIVKVVTGSGKTVFAISLISDLINSDAYKDGGLSIIIIVPTNVLLEQWLFEISDKLHIPRDKIGVFYGKQKEDLSKKAIIIYVVNSARVYLQGHFEAYFKLKDIFFIADECHRYGSKENSKIFKVPFSFTLGLSATPERYGDYGFQEKLLPNLGKVIFNYTYNEALKDGIIPPYKLIRMKVNLSAYEQIRYDEYTEKIGRILNALLRKYPKLNSITSYDFIRELNKIYENIGDELILKYTILLNKRKSIIHLSESKLKALEWLLKRENMHNDKILIFHERIESAESILRNLTENGLDAGMFHSEMTQNERLKSISDFKDGKIRILVSCRALDEGFDVPKADTGIIVAGTSSIRQWIQRMGRILRINPGKEYSKIYVIFASLVEKDVFNEKELSEFEKEAFSVELINLSIKQEFEV